METNDDNSYDTDLDDNETDQIGGCKPSQLTFVEKVAAHHSNRLNQTFGQINIPDEYQSQIIKEVNDETLVPLRFKRSSENGRVRIYETSCQALDITTDWQIRACLPYDTINIVDRSFSFNDFRAFATAIEVNLESLTLHSVCLTSRSLHILCQALKKCIHLNLLDISDNKIGKKGFESLVDTFKYLPSLLYLSLANCDIHDSYSFGIGHLCRHEKLIEMNLSGNKFEENACIFIGSALTENTSLAYLNLSWNSIRSYASIALFRGLEVNQHVTELDISWSGLSYDGSVALRRVLVFNKVLQRLNISNCKIEWMSAKLISEGLAKNATLQALNLAYNPITTHGAQYIIQSLDGKTSAVSMLDISGITVYSTTVRLAEKIAKRRNFVMKYDCEIPIHDVLGRHKVTKGDSMRKVIEHIDDRKWRALEYFRMLDRTSKGQLENKSVTFNILKSGIQLENDDVKVIHERFTLQAVQPLTYQNLNTIINQHRMRDRSLKAQQEKQENDIKKRNQKILQKVSHHFPDIEIISKYQKRKEAIEQLARPRVFSADHTA